jgi:formate dehydrogenase subunit delta
MPLASQVRMANDIARQFAHLPPDQGAAGVAAHLRSFWDPRMRAQLLDLVAAGGSGLDPLVLAAAQLLAAPSLS